MTVSDARKRANAKYAKNNVRQIGLKFYPAESALYEWAKSRENVQGYIKALIRTDMEKGETNGD